LAKEHSFPQFTQPLISAALCATLLFDDYGDSGYFNRFKNTDEDECV
jgi:hypothetical protein